MQDFISYSVLIIYSFCLLMIFGYSLSHLSLLFSYLKFQKEKKTRIAIEEIPQTDWPFITIQLPVYNEKYVMSRLLHRFAEMNYPADKFEIQVLDDSTDDSLLQNKKIVDEIAVTGIDMKHVTRASRSQFKAGALKEGLEKAKGNFIAIFDADFLPPTDWLKKTILHFEDEHTGMVQTRWGHLNRDYSLLTKVQAFALDAHFTLEQAGRNARDYFMNFNGTAGMWRKQCILDAGNWRGDTLTEDLDLSYRAQLIGWKFKYLEDVVAPAELPVVMSATRSQQYRWNKGGAENFVHHFKRIVLCKNISVAKKIHALLHLGNSSMFLFVFIIALLSVPVLFIKKLHPELVWLFNINGVFIISTIIFFISYWVVYKKLHGKEPHILIGYIKMFLSYFTIALGFSFHNSMAIVQAYSGRKTDFIRTPKFNIQRNSDSWKGNGYMNEKISWKVIVEILLCLYFAFGMGSAFYLKDFGLFIFHAMLFTGFAFVVYYTFKTRAS